jgi:hypothetical protein
MDISVFLVNVHMLLRVSSTNSNILGYRTTKKEHVSLLSYPILPFFLRQTNINTEQRACSLPLQD